MPPETPRLLRFGRFQISPAERMLRVDGVPAALGTRAFDLLLVLAERRERLVGKQELLDLVWPGVVVEEHNITAQISSLRKLLGPSVIATVPGRGYQFVATPDAPAAETSHDRTPARHNLPGERTRFIGRAAALAEMDRLLGASRLLTLTGIGGCGKTRLALQFARQRIVDFPGGAWFIDLAPLNEPERVAAACAAVVDPGSDPDSSAVERLAAHLGDRHALLVLDNCEHVLAGAAALADALLARPGRTRILATSREPLAVAGEQLYPVRSLSLPATPDLDDVRAADAVGVFVDRARLAMPEFEVDAANAADLVEICRRLDGIALAIELAAARVTMLSVGDIAARLEDRFRLLTGGRSPDARHQTLLAAMQWSHDLLAPAEQHMLRQLAVFAGGCTLEAASAVAQVADEYEALMLLTALHDKSLLVVERGAGSKGGGPPRYRMLETVRQYAQQRLDEAGEADAARARHAEYFMALAESAAPHLRGPQQIEWMARLREEQENLVAAITWCVQETSPVDREWGPRLTAATARYWVFNDIDLGYRLTRAALQRDSGAADSRARWENLSGLATMCMHRGDGDEGATHARAALEVAQRLGVLEWQAMAMNGLAACLDRSGAEEAALQHFRQARDLARASGDATALSYILNNVAGVEFGQGKLESAEQGYRQSLHLARGRGDILGTLITLHNLVRVLVAAGKHDDAGACAIEAEALLRGMGDSVMRLELIEVAAGLASSRGEHHVAARFWGASRSRFSDAGYTRPSVDQIQLEQLSAITRQALGPAAFELGEAAGRALDLDVAMHELRQWLQGDA